MAISENRTTATIPSRVMAHLQRPHDGKPLSAWRLSAYAAPSIPLSGLGFPLGVFLPAFYAEQMGVGMTTVGVVFMLTRVWDAVTDPLLGVVSDKYPTRFGRRRHWMAISIPILMVSTVFVFMPQYILSGPASGAYIFLSLIVLYVGYTLLLLSHKAWGAELSTDYHERSRIQGWRELIHAAGMLSVFFLPVLIELTDQANNIALKVESMGWFVIVLLPLLTLWAIFSVGEQDVTPQPTIGYRKALTTLFKNKYMLRVIIVDILIATPTGVASVTFMFFAKYVVEAGGIATMILLFVYIGQMIGIPIWIRLGKHISKHRIVSFGIVWYSFMTLCFMFLGPGDGWLFMFINFGIGVGYSGTSFFLRSITADVVDYDTVESGTQRTGLYFALMAMTQKMGPALAVGITFPLLAVLGFDPSKGVPDANAIAALRYTFVFVPIASLAVAGIMMYSFPLDEGVQKALRQKIDEREAQSE